MKADLTLKDRVYICNECGLKIDRDYNASLNLLTELKKQIGKVLAEFTSADLTAMQSDLVINQIVTSKVETEIQQKSYL
ncbi:MAG TPA: zinc ribbon domain-containing protein [Planctomycetota bacterium]|nr:zinc ribbon domain-containing protein [Planctomycetota bacterium]